ncbi:MAG: TIM barrel protein [Akkermansiaceae bacterium]|nr:TIM barrel protein [Akkermansiaceae bacterium]
MDCSRRRFLKTATGGALALGAPGLPGGAAVPGRDAWPVAAFEKNFQRLTYDEIGRRMAALGLQGIEATVRPGGHIDPDRAAAELPPAVEALARHGLTILVMASGVNEVNPRNEKVLRAAAGLGIKRYRMAYWQYAKDAPVRRQLREFREKASDLAALNKDLGIQGIYQNHAGAHHVGGPLWDLQQVLEGIDPAHLAIGLDLRHSRVENGMSWKTTYDLVRPHVAMLYVKDARWNGTKIENVPLGEGMVTREVFRHAVKGCGPLPIALHVEYFGGKPLPAEALPPVIDAHRQDLATLRKWIG